MRRDPDVQQTVASYTLGIPQTPTAGWSGELLGRGTGSSLEFQEYREYLPGDDIRHLDWAAYARSDALMVRLYREEISPRTEILLDVTRSMTTGDGQKALVCRQLATVFAMLAGQLGGRPQVMLLGDETPVRALNIEGLSMLEQEVFNSRTPLPQLLDLHSVTLMRRAVRIVISDFLFLHDPEVLIRKLATDASALWVLQILTQWESDPEPLGGRRMIDIETDGEADLLINRKLVGEYNLRLKRLQDELARSCRRMHAVFVPLIADRGLKTLAREDLSAAGILRPI